MNIMKYLFCFLWSLLIAFPCIAQTSNAEAKAQINKIKKSSSYLYGEATLATTEDAIKLANEILIEEIDAWIKEKKKLRESNNVVVKNISKVFQQMTLPRGNMYRAFIYVKKSDIIPSDNVTVVATDNASNYIPAGNNTPNAEEAPQKSGMTSAQETALQAILRLTDFNQLKNCLTSLKREGKISDYGKYSSLTQPENYHLIIYNRQGVIEAVLSPGKNIRTNLKTQDADNIGNYKGRGAIGFKF